MAQKQQQYLMLNKIPFTQNTAFRPSLPSNNFAMNKLAYQSKLLQGKNALSPALAQQYRAIAYVNQVNKQKLLLKKTLQAQAAKQQVAETSSLCTYPSSCLPLAMPPWIHNCPPICRTSCIPQCPNECCLRSPKATSEIV